MIATRSTAMQHASLITLRYTLENPAMESVLEDLIANAWTLPMTRLLLLQMVLAFIGAFTSLLVIAAINSAIGGRISLPLLLAPFGATCTLLFVS